MLRQGAIAQRVIGQQITGQWRGVFKHRAGIRIGLGRGRRCCAIRGEQRVGRALTGTVKSEIQRCRGFHDAGQAHESAAAFTAAAERRGRGVQRVERILTGVDGGDDLVYFGRRRRGDRGLLGLGRSHQIGGEQHFLVLTHDQRRLAVGLQLHRTARRSHDHRIRGDAHALMDGGQSAIGVTNPSLAGELGNENGLRCHDDLRLQSVERKRPTVFLRYFCRHGRSRLAKQLLASRPIEPCSALRRT